MSAAELATLQLGADLYVRVSLIEHHGDSLTVSFADRRGSQTIQIAANDVINFAPLSLKRSGQAIAMRLADFDIPTGASSWASANSKR
jgi:hypothetical protein